MAVCNYNCTELPTHEKIQCGQFKFGGNCSIGILECDHSITDFESTAQLDQAIIDGELTLIEPVRAEIPDASPVEGTNPDGCGTETILDNFDRTAIWEDYNVTSANQSFYDALNDRNAGLIIFNGTNNEITVIDENGNFIAFRNSPTSNQEKEKYNVTFKWTRRTEPLIFDAPAGVFRQSA